MNNKNILISGAGIAGLTLTYWLKKYGFHPAVVEQAPKLREGGYAIDFFGSGFDIAEKMGILFDLEKNDLKIQELIFVDKNNHRKGGLHAFQIRKLLNNRFTIYFGVIWQKYFTTILTKTLNLFLETL